MNKPPRFSVVIPVYNEKAHVLACLRETDAYFRARKESYEIVVVDDGSADGTTEILKGSKGIRFLPMPANEGKGAAVRRGVYASRGEYVLFMDVDLSTPIRMFDNLFLAIQKADIAIASRRLTGSDIRAHQPLVRRIMGTVFYGIIRLLLVPNIHDTNCGFKLFTRRACDIIFPRQTIARWGFDAELLFIARKRGLTVAEVPVTWKNSDNSHVRIAGAAIGTLLEVGRILWNNAVGRYD